MAALLLRAAITLFTLLHPRKLASVILLYRTISSSEGLEEEHGQDISIIESWATIEAQRIGDALEVPWSEINRNLLNDR
ncbi:MAG: hypothetical protein EOO27_30415 [Comamonadaceae bacterium]|nr:MAG: hypothetical protein EOO27_30415 [Comamonadaceae bacterium]